jgi:hypothetical protein
MPSGPVVREAIFRPRNLNNRLSTFKNVAFAVALFWRSVAHRQTVALILLWLILLWLQIGSYKQLYLPQIEPINCVDKAGSAFTKRPQLSDRLRRERMGFEARKIL